MQTHEVLKRPLITERATNLAERFNQIMFEVDLRANKYQIRDAVEQRYGVRVEKVRTSVLPGKLRRKGKDVGRRPNRKKAIVSLRKGDTIDFYGTE